MTPGGATNGTNNALSDTNTLTIIAKNIYGTNVTNTVAAILPSPLSLTNDSDGNLKSDGTRWFEYSPDEQLTAVTGRQCVLVERLDIFPHQVDAGGDTGCPVFDSAGIPEFQSSAIANYR